MSIIAIKKEPGANVSYQKDGGTKQVFHAAAFSFSAQGVNVNLSCGGSDLSFKSTDTITINGAPFTGNAYQIIDFLNSEVFAGAVALPPTPVNTGGTGGGTGGNTGGGSISMTSPDGAVWTFAVSNEGVLSLSKP